MNIPVQMKRFSRMGAVAASLLCWSQAATAGEPPLVSHEVADALAQEISGERAFRELEGLTRRHRMRGSKELRAAADQLAAGLAAAGLADVQILTFPADGKIFYGTQRSRAPWNARFAELWEMAPDGEGFKKSVRLADFATQPVTLAQDSASGAALAALVDVGAGVSAADYEGKDVRGKLVLTSSQPEAVQKLAIGRFGAAGIITYALNQKTAWQGDDASLLRWGHLDSFAQPGTFAFVISLEQARAFQGRLAKGETIMLDAQVDAGWSKGGYEILTATIPGADPKAGEIVFSCHLDHQRPGANDNASGCATIHEVAVSLATLIREKRIARPARTLRFVFPPEIEGTLALLNGRPDLARRFKAAIHLDMVGGDHDTGAVFRVTGTPASLPSVVSDVAGALALFVGEETLSHASGEAANFPLVAPEGTKGALQPRLSPFDMGSDNQVYLESSWSIPAIYLNDWPDRFIHTNKDRPENIDPTKLKRVAFIAAASGLALAGYADGDDLWAASRPAILRRAALMDDAAAKRSAADAENLRFEFWRREGEVVRSIGRFAGWAGEAEALAWLDGLAQALGRGAPLIADSETARRVYARNPAVKGPMTGFGYSWLDDKLTGDGAATTTQSAANELVTYDALNLVNGERSVGAIRSILDAAYGPASLEDVAGYLETLAKIDVIRRVDARAE
jgi:hypothetical protein